MIFMMLLLMLMLMSTQLIAKMHVATTPLDAVNLATDRAIS